MNLFQVKQNQTVKIIDLKKGSQFQDKSDPVLERLELLGFRVGESLQVLAKGLFGGDPVLVQIETSRFALRKNEAERIFVEIINEH
ncbi:MULTISPECIES: FeoA family protein [Acinetobacter]|uniref:FeoA domain protein n=2 Tax=Acinetobacter calcoaceticus/baumannii complex TaxID=909768 RepID=A0A0E8PEF3_ACIBA|nr:MULTISPECIES: FeoA family protein [Acinetobacter]EXB08407.1 feoA domain protein [Acinetobacter baumannii 1397084]EYD49759.1 feoA domain protein [Acinetobacter baumannii 25493_4]EYS11388.1 feoA domain protein [Acinetobacter baumannii 25569_7]CAH1088009.1 FeoA domain [Acinetobacter phage MD-2021a]SSW77457.1 FeoA domain [Klebsiella pneumoniae]